MPLLYLLVGFLTIGLILYLANKSERVFSEERSRHSKIEEQLSRIISEKTEALQKVSAELKQRLDELYSAMAEVHRSEQFLRTIFDSISDPFCIIASNFRIIRANDVYAKMKKKSLDELIGSICYKALYNKNNVCDSCVIDKTFRTGEPLLKENLFPDQKVTENGLRYTPIPYSFQKVKFPTLLSMSGVSRSVRRQRKKSGCLLRCLRDFQGQMALQVYLINEPF